MSLWIAALLGMIEGLTEFLPVSSTAHLILTEMVLGLQSTNFLDTFDIVIQAGAILAVVVTYFRSFFNRAILQRLIVAFIPTGILGLLLYSFIKKYFLNNFVVILCALFIGGVFMILFEWWYAKRQKQSLERQPHTQQQTIETLSYKQAFLIGLAQSAAMIPGVSRSAASIIGGLAMGIERSVIVEFSFLLAVPTIGMATLYSLVKHPPAIASGEWTFLLVGFVTAFLVALAVIRWFMRFIRQRTFILFGIYRILLVIAVLALVSFVFFAVGNMAVR